MKKTVAAIPLILALLATGLWAAQAAPCRNARSNCFPPVFEKLDLTKNQKADLTKILDKYKESQDKIRKDSSAARASLHDAMLNGKEEAVREAYRNLAKVEEEQVVIRLKIMNELKPLLSPDQLKRLQTQPPCPGPDGPPFHKQHMKHCNQ